MDMWGVVVIVTRRRHSIFFVVYLILKLEAFAVKQEAQVGGMVDPRTGVQNPLHGLVITLAY